VHRLLGDRAVLLDLKNSCYYSLNDTGAAIWQLLDGVRDLERVLNEMIAIYDTPRMQCHLDLQQLIGRLLAADLVELA